MLATARREQQSWGLTVCGKQPLVGPCSGGHDGRGPTRASQGATDCLRVFFKGGIIPRGVGNNAELVEDAHVTRA